MPKSFWKWYDRAARIDFAGTLLGHFFDWKPWILGFKFGGGVGLAGAVVTFLLAAVQGHSPVVVWVLALVCFAALTVVITAITLLFSAIRFLRRKNRESLKKGMTQPALALSKLSGHVEIDDETRRLAGIVNAIKEIALKYSFRLPVSSDDPFIGHYHDVEGSAHPIWANRETSQLRTEFLHWVGILGSRHQIPGTAADLRESRSETSNYAAQLSDMLLGKSRSNVSIQLNTSAQAIDDYRSVCAVTVSGADNLDNCLVQLEQFSGSWPNGMPNPLVLRTDGQIRGTRSGRFKLSKGQPKTIPIAFYQNIRRNEWFFFDERGVKYFTQAQPTKMVLRLYGGLEPVTALLIIDTDAGWNPKPSLRIVADSYILN